MGLLDFQIRAPEVATIVRWLLRVVLVVFLAWLLKGRAEEEQEEEVSDEADERSKRNGQTFANGKSRGQYQRPSTSRYPPQRQGGKDPYANNGVRQRRPGNNESLDFDAVISKMSKPKEMWEVRKSGEAPILRRQSFGEGEESTTESRKTPTNGKEQERAKPDSGQNSQRRESRQTEEANSVLKKTMLHAHARPVTFITWNRDCNLLFTCGKDKLVSVWSFPEGECLGSYNGHQGAVWACSVTSDSRWLVTSGADRLVIVWEARTSRELSRIELPGVVRFVEWASAGSRDASAGSERFVTAHNRFGSHPASLTVWRFDGTSIEEQIRIADLPTPATQVRWGRDDLLLVSSHENGELIFWQANDGTEVRRLKAHDTLISKFDFSTDRELLATASTDMKVKVWDLGSGSEGTLLYHVETDRPLNTVALGPLTRAAAVCGANERPETCTVIAAGGQDVRDVAMSNSTSDQFDTLLFRLGMEIDAPRNLQADGSAKGHFGPVHTLAYMADGSAMASGSEDGCVRLHVFNAAAVAARETK